MSDEEQKWKELQLEEMTPVEAESLFYQRIKPPLAAVNPHNLKKHLRVIFDPPQFIDHCLYKGETRHHYATFTRKPEEFQLDRAIRMNWIQETLLNPDYVLRREEDQALIFIAHACDNETTKCILKPVKIPTYRFITFHIAYPDEEQHMYQLQKDLLEHKMLYRRKK